MVLVVYYFESLKTESKVIAVAKGQGRRQSIEPIKLLVGEQCARELHLVRSEEVQVSFKQSPRILMLDLLSTLT